MPLVHQIVGAWLKSLKVLMMTFDEKVSLLWCVTYINETYVRIYAL